MTTEQYKQQLIHDIIVDKINSIELEQRLNNLIMLAQNERAMELNRVLFPDSVIGGLITEPEVYYEKELWRGKSTAYDTGLLKPKEPKEIGPHNII